MVKNKQENKRGGRPSSYSPEIVSHICDRLSNGEPLEEICRDPEVGKVVRPRTIYDWIEGRVASVPDSVSTDIARAREIGYDAIAARTRKVAKGEVGYSSQDVQRDKLIIETDLKLLSKWTKKYGDRQQLDVTGHMTLGQLVEQSAKPKE